MSYSNCQFTWLKQKETLISLTESLLKDSAFFDCQLCAEGHHFNVHRVILSCNSPIFCNILQEHNSDLPVITLEGISSAELGALVEFMYTGVTRIAPEYLRNFFQIAKSLQLAGLNHYDSAQIEKIINESGPQVADSELQDNYEAYSQNILKYLDESELSNDSEEKELTTLDASDESIFLEEASGLTEIVTDRSGNYQTGFLKHESEDAVETLDTQMVENVSQTCDIVDSVEIEDNLTEAPLTYQKFENMYIKNKDEVSNKNVTMYSISNLGELESKEGGQFVKVEEELKVMDEDENYVYVKVDNINTINRLQESQESVAQNTSISDVQVYKSKCIKAINPVEKNYSVKAQKIEAAVSRVTQSCGEDKKIYICLKCGNKYSHRRTLLHHIHWICEQPATYSCSLCPYKGKRKFQLKSHMKHAHLLKLA